MQLFQLSRLILSKNALFGYVFSAEWELSTRPLFFDEANPHCQKWLPVWLLDGANGCATCPAARTSRGPADRTPQWGPEQKKGRQPLTRPPPMLYNGFEPKTPTRDTKQKAPDSCSYREPFLSTRTEVYRKRETCNS